MYLKKSKQTNGRIHLDIMDNYYDPVKKTTRQKTIKSLGYVDQLEHIYDNPIEYYTNLLNDYKTTLENDPFYVSFHFQENEKMNNSHMHEKNFGFIIFSKIYHGLEIHKFFTNKQRHRNDSYNANELFKVLLNGNLLSRYDRKNWFQKKQVYLTHELTNFFDFMSKNTFDLFKWFHKHIQNYYDRGSCYVYENIAKFSFGTSNSAELEINRSKTNRIQNSIYLSIYLDSHGVPYAYRKVDKYNRNENYTEFLQKLQDNLDIKKFVIVGDRIKNTEEELHQEIASNENIRYVFSINPIIASLETQEYITDLSLEQSYTKSTKYKTRLCPRVIPLEDGNQKIILERQLILRNETKRIIDAQERANLLDKANSIINFASQFSALEIGEEIKYIKKVVFLPNGRIDIDNSILEIDYDMVAHVEQFDGVKFIITNEPIKSINHIIDVYYYQYSLENVLKNTRCTMQRKSPRFKQDDYNNYTTTVNTVTFTGLIMLRLLFLAMDKKYSMTQLLQAISKYNCVLIQKNYYLFTYYDNILDDLGQRLELDLNKRIRTLKEIKHIIAQVKKTDFEATLK